MLLRRFFLLANCFFIAGCTYTSALQKQRSNISPYSEALRAEYETFATSELNQYDWFDGEYFAKKGLQVSASGRVFLEVPSAWDLPEQNRDELARAYLTMKRILTPEMMVRFPAEIAHAQAMYECWLEQQEENWQPEHIALCRDGFMNALKIFEGAKKDKKIKPVKIRAEENSNSRVSPDAVYFDFDSYRLTQESRKLLQAYAKKLRENKQDKLRVEGHTDRAGADDYNLRLSERRAKVVADLLAKQSVGREQMQVRGLGESRPKIETADGLVERRNRRVELIPQ
jgi:OOP family OmpA-OmpF porin